MDHKSIQALQRFKSGFDFKIWNNFSPSCGLGMYGIRDFWVTYDFNLSDIIILFVRLSPVTNIILAAVYIIFLVETKQNCKGY